MSNITSASGEASVTSGGNIGDDTTELQQQQLRPVTASGGCTVNNSTLQSPAKRKRKLPGTPDPDAEVIALSPKTLMATNRFICEICNKGFQRDQNLQLHRRGHNLPWKLRQRSSTEIRKRVYICPETTCVHHDPIRALGDLTGIKKHFCRKHGEKKWKCDKCSKRYAVQSDWKAHIKTCGTREYRCDCGTLFSRRDSFITHRAFCDALAEDSTRISEGITIGGQLLHSQMSSISAGKSSITNPPAISLHGGHLSSRLGESRLSTNWEKPNSRPARSRHLSLLLGPQHHDQGAQDEIMQGPGNNNSHTILQNRVNPTEISPVLIFNHRVEQSTKSNNMARCLLGLSDPDAESQLGVPKPNLAELLPMPMTTSNSGSIYSNNFSSHCGATSQFHGTMNGFPGAMDHIHKLMNSSITSSSGSGNHGPIISTDAHGRTGSGQQQNMIMSSACSSHGAQMSATALLQKAAQMGATASNSPLLNIKGFGMAGLDSSSGASAAALRRCWQDRVAHNQRPESVSNNSHLEHSFNPAFNIRAPNIDNHAADVAINPPLGSPYFTATGTGRSSDNSGGLQDLMNSLPAPEAAAASLYLGENLDRGMHEQYGHQDEQESLLHHSGSSTFLNGGSDAHSTDNYISTQHHHQHVHNTVKNISINEVFQGANNILNPMSGSKQQLTPARTAHGSADQDGGDNLTRDFLGVGVRARANNMVLNNGGDDHAGRIRRSVLSRVLPDRDHPVNSNSRSQHYMVGSALIDLDSYDNNNG